MKAYWVCIYDKIDNLEKLREYACKAKPAVEKFSGKFSIKLNDTQCGFKLYPKKVAKKINVLKNTITNDKKTKT